MGIDYLYLFNYQSIIFKKFTKFGLNYYFDFKVKAAHFKKIHFIRVQYNFGLKFIICWIFSCFLINHFLKLRYLFINLNFEFNLIRLNFQKCLPNINFLIASFVNLNSNKGVSFSYRLNFIINIFSNESSCNQLGFNLEHFIIQFNWNFKSFTED